MAEGRFGQKTVSAGGAFGRGPLRQRRPLFAEYRIRESAVSTEDRFAGGPPLQSDILTARNRHTSQEKPGSIQEDQEAVREQPGSSQRGQGAARADQEQPEATSGQPGAAKGSWEQPGAAKSSQGQPVTAKGSQKHPGAARKSQIICVFIVLNSNRTSKVLNHMCFHSSKLKPYF